MRLWKAVTLTSGTKVYWMIGAMIGTVITARFLGPQGRGVIAAATSWVALFVTFGHFSLANVIVYLLGGQEREKLLPVVAGSVMALTAATTLLGWGIAGALHFLTHGLIFQHIAPPVLVIAFAGLPFLLWMENGNSLLIVLGDLKRLNLAQAAGTTIGVALVALTVGVFRGGVAAALTATLVSYVVVVGFGLTRIVAASRPLGVSRVILRELLGGGARLHLAAVSTFFFTNIAVILLNQFRPVAEAGFFQLAMQLTLAMQVVPMAIAVVAYSIVTRDGAEQAWRQHRMLILQTMLYSAAAAMIAYVAAPIIVPLLAGRAFQPAVPVFRVVELSIFGMSLSAVMAPQWVARGYFLRLALLSVLAALVGIVGNSVLIPRYGMAASAWVMVTSYTIHFAGNAAFGVWIDRRTRLVSTLEPLRGSMPPPRSLYICYFGLREPLVQTQVLPYLRELAAGNVTMSLLTFEPERFDETEWRERLYADGIEWTSLPYHKRPVLPATGYDIVRGAFRVAAIARRDGTHIFHGRSHVGTAIGALAKWMSRGNLIFDFRGFLADEYVDRGNWRAGGLLYRLTKAAERRLLREADGVVFLTERMREALDVPVEVIPCCVDAKRFAIVDRAKLGLVDRVVYVYSGTLGGNYLVDETAALLAAARQDDPRTFALVLTQSAPQPMIAALQRAGFSPDDYRVLTVSPDNVPRYLHAADVGLSLIRMSYASRAQSPTKFAEYLAAGLPVISTAGIGDLDAQITQHRVGVLLRRFDAAAYAEAIRAMTELRCDPELADRCRSLASDEYDMHSVGGARYRRLYDAVLHA